MPRWSDQLQYALHSRIAIEQAKGILAQEGGIGMDEAFSRLRSHARSRQRSLTEVAEEVVAGTLGLDALIGDRTPMTRSPT